ncbi:hypothetical protein B0H14DRAFT_3461827 [Mycena olivaceomarginata]|nr:hypothetical protein B0H14DRAFT_3461827 [Mycena olivaceomarginata]
MSPVTEAKCSFAQSPQSLHTRSSTLLRRPNASAEADAIFEDFSVDENGGISRSGSAEDPEADLESDLDVNAESDVEPVVLGRGQRKKTVSKRYQGPIWEEH